jgi:hypothetical protein
MSDSMPFSCLFFSTIPTVIFIEVRLSKKAEDRGKYSRANRSAGNPEAARVLRSVLGAGSIS